MNRREFLASGSAAGASAAFLKAASAQTLQDCPPRDLPLVPRTQDYLYRPKPQFWSFANQDPILQVGPFHLSFQVFTTGANENSYGLLKDCVEVTARGDGFRIKASSLAGAGQQTKSSGSLDATCTRIGANWRIQVHAEAPENLRAVKVRLHQLPEARVIQTGWNVDPNGLPVVSEGINLIYPEYQGGMPGWQLAFATGSLGMVSMDPEPRPKRFTAYSTPTDRIVELTFEEDARRFSNSIETPPWDLLPNASLAH